MTPEEKAQIKNKHLAYAAERGSEKTFCPSEVARDLYADDWRDKMDDVRAVADLLVKEQVIQVLQKGEIKTKLPSELKGPIRLQIKKGNKPSNKEKKG